MNSTDDPSPASDPPGAACPPVCGDAALDLGAELAPPAEPAADAPDGGLAGLVAALRGDMARLQAAFDAKIKYDAAREAIIDRLHGELQEYKADLVLKVLRPLATDLIDLYDDMGAMLAGHEERVADSAPGQKLLGLLRQFRDDIEHILDRYGVEAFELPEGEFDPRQQRAIERVPTDDPALNRRIAARLRKGFRYEGRVLRPEFVKVYVVPS